MPKAFPEVIKNIDEEYFSDMLPEEIPDSEVSDVEIDDEVNEVLAEDLLKEEKQAELLQIQMELT